MFFIVPPVISIPLAIFYLGMVSYLLGFELFYLSHTFPNQSLSYYLKLLFFHHIYLFKIVFVVFVIANCVIMLFTSLFLYSCLLSESFSYYLVLMDSLSSSGSNGLSNLGGASGLGSNGPSGDPSTPLVVSTLNDQSSSPSNSPSRNSDETINPSINSSFSDDDSPLPFQLPLTREAFYAIVLSNPFNLDFEEHFNLASLNASKSATSISVDVESHPSSNSSSLNSTLESISLNSDLKDPSANTKSTNSSDL